MTIAYQNTKTGKVADMAEPAEYIAAGEAEAERLLAERGPSAEPVVAGLLERTRAAAAHAGHTIDRMDKSTKWERLDDTTANSE